MVQGFRTIISNQVGEIDLANKFSSMEALSSQIFRVKIYIDPCSKADCYVCGPLLDNIELYISGLTNLSSLSRRNLC